MAKIPAKKNERPQNAFGKVSHEPSRRSDDATIKLTVVIILGVILLVDIIGCIICITTESKYTHDFLWSFSSWIISGIIGALITIAGYSVGKNNSPNS